MSRTKKAKVVALPAPEPATHLERECQIMTLKHVSAMRDALVAVAMCAGRDSRALGNECETPAELVIAFDVLNNMALELLEANLDHLHSAHPDWVHPGAQEAES